MPRSNIKPRAIPQWEATSLWGAGAQSWPIRLARAAVRSHLAASGNRISSPPRSTPSELKIALAANQCRRASPSGQPSSCQRRWAISRTRCEAFFSFSMSLACSTCTKRSASSFDTKVSTVSWPSLGHRQVNGFGNGDRLFGRHANRPRRSLSPSSFSD